MTHYTKSKSKSKKANVNTRAATKRRQKANAVQKWGGKAIIELQGNTLVPIKGDIVTTEEGVVLANAKVLEERFDLTRRALDNVRTFMKLWYHPDFEAYGAFPDPIQIKGRDYWELDAVEKWVTNYKHVCAIRVITANVPRALAFFSEWIKENKYPPWCWGTIFGTENSKATIATHTAMERLIDYVLADTGRGEVKRDFQFNGSVSTLTLKVEKVQEKPVPIPYAGAPSSGVLFIDERNAPSHPTNEWLRSQIQEHLAAATTGTLVVAISAGVLLFLIADRCSSNV